MKEVIKTVTGSITIFFLLWILICSLVCLQALTQDKLDQFNSYKIVGAYAVSGFMVLCNGVVYAILSRSDTKK